MLTDDGVSGLKDYFSFDQDRKEKFDGLPWQLVCARLIINNSLFSKTRTFLKEQYLVNQSNYPDTMIEAIAMITLFGNDDISGRGNNKITNKIPEENVSINLTNCCSYCPYALLLLRTTMHYYYYALHYALPICTATTYYALLLPRDTFP